MCIRDSNNGSDEIYMGSADWMPRNLDRRVEIVFPVEDEQIKNEIKHVLDLEFRDNVKALSLIHICRGASDAGKRLGAFSRRSHWKNGAAVD